MEGLDDLRTQIAALRDDLVEARVNSARVDERLSAIEADVNRIEKAAERRTTAAIAAVTGVGLALLGFLMERVF